jgi:hypothetical protein
MILRKCFVLGAFIIVTSLFVFSDGFKPLKERTIRAQRISEEIRIDGLLDEAAWKGEGYSDFVQSEPIDGGPPSQRTVVWVNFDDKALYIAARLYDSHPEKITKRLGRRDDEVQSDWFYVGLDTYFDRLSGFAFAVNPAGSIMDGTISNDTKVDWTWDGVWNWAARTDAEGWTVEIRVPYDQLRFPNKDEYTWGIFFRRSTLRQQEIDDFVWIPKDESGLVSRFARLEGIRSINPPAHLEVTPYAVGRSEFKPAVPGDPFGAGQKFGGNLGADIKVGLATNLTLDAALNPDFGQV